MIRRKLLILVLLTQLLLKECCADCEKDEDAVEEGRKCRKSCEVDGDCKGVKTCQCDGACGLTCFNKMVGCNDTDAPENGRVKHYGEGWGRKAYYTCNEGYVRVGVRYSTCYADKKFSPAGPECQAGCLTPTDVAHSYPVEGGSAQLGGKDHTFACGTGFYMIGNPTRTCIEHERGFGWSAAKFSCHIQTCGPIEEVDNGVIHYSKGYNFTSFATLQCEKGYDIVGSDRMRMKCEAGRAGSRSGRWTGTLPSCSIISCPEINSLENGYIQHAKFVEYTYRSRITFKCNEGYKVKGNAEVICNADGHWSALPECIDDMDCNFNSASSETCRYANVANAWRRIATREWNGFDGFALKSTKYNSVLRSSYLKPSLTESFVCLKFYYKLTESGKPDMLRIKNTSNSDIIYWENHENERTDEWLSALTQLDIRSGLKFYFITAKPNVRLDDIVVESGKCVDNCQDDPCENGGSCVNRAHGHTCFCTREFSGQNCEFDRSCPSLPSKIRNGYLNSRKPYRAMPDTRATYRCAAGYKLSNKQGITTTSTVTCRSSDGDERSNWSPDPNSLGCEEITCNAPGVGKNQQINKNKLFWVAGDVVKYSCIEGFEFFNGRTTEDRTIARRCSDDGNWLDSIPDCYRPMCTFPESSSGPQAIYRQSRYSAGKSIKVRCPEGEELVGSNIVTCVNKGQWSHEVRCRKFTCGRIPDVENRKNPEDNPSKNYGETYTYQCQDDYYISGNPTVTCRIDGQFTETPICREIGYCTFPAHPKHGKREGNQKEVRFSCDKMYTLVGSSSAACDHSTREWSHAAPRCVEKAPYARKIYENIEYLVFMEQSLQSNYDDSNLLCNSIGGNLAILYNSPVRRHLETALKRTPTYQLRIALKRPAGVRYDRFEWDLDLRRTNFSRGWESNLNDRHWDSGYPNRRRYDNCVAIQSDSRFTSFDWRNVRCDDRKPFVCQRKYTTCRSTICKNGGECYVEEENEKCRCEPHFHGDRCESEVTCDISTLPRNIKAVEDRKKYSVGSKVYVDCVYGNAVGSRWMICAKNGRWGTAKPRCEGGHYKCSALPSRLGANLRTIDRVSHYLAGKHYRLRCDDGYKLVGDYSAYCNWDGQWAEASTKCERITCPEPDLPENVVISRGVGPYHHGSRITLGCSTGRSVGESVATCQADGNWTTNGMFSCVATTTTPRPTTTTTTTEVTTRMPECEEPTLPPFVSIETPDPKPDSYSEGAQVKLKCVPGQQIEGSSSWTCRNGAWIFESKTSCIVNVCNLDIYLLSDGVKVQGYTDLELYNAKFKVNDEVTLICEDSTKTVQHYDEPDTEPTVRCKLRGRWSSEPGDFDCV